MMPSLLKYFTIVGGALVGLLIVLNSVMAPGGPGPALVKAEAPKPAVKHDPNASKVERLRAEEAAAEKAAKAAAAEAEAASLVVTEPPMPARPVQAAAQPAQVIAPAALATDPEGEAARAKRLAQEKVKAEKAAAKARKARLARERARTRALEEASAQQHVPLQPQTYGYAPRPAYGPFAQGGGWQGGWQGQRW